MKRAEKTNLAADRGTANPRPLADRAPSRRIVTLSCRNVWKLFGHGAEVFLKRNPEPSEEALLRADLIRAVEPEIWFLDEPFSALDPLIRREMQDEFTRLQAVLHKTIVFITHDFDEAIRLADRVAIMKDGEIIQLGAPEDLVVNPATAY